MLSCHQTSKHRLPYRGLSFLRSLFQTPAQSAADHNAVVCWPSVSGWETVRISTSSTLPGTQVMLCVCLQASDATLLAIVASLTIVRIGWIRPLGQNALGF